MKLYVRLGNMSALTEQKLHRLKLLTEHKDITGFSFGLLREHCERDIVAIDAGIREFSSRNQQEDMSTSARQKGFQDGRNSCAIPIYP